MRNKSAYIRRRETDQSTLEDDKQIIIIGII